MINFRISLMASEFLTCFFREISPPLQCKIVQIFSRVLQFLMLLLLAYFFPFHFCLTIEDSENNLWILKVTNILLIRVVF